jgi:glycolate oxidase
MNRILHIDTENFMAEVEPGVVTYDLQQAVEKKGLFYPPDPASHKTSTIGGNVAENAGGLRCFKYGVTGDYVLELEAFLITGEKIKSGSHTIKNVAGYDLKSLLVGSEGTLAVISKVVLKLLPLPEQRLTFRVNFQSLKKGAEFINQVISGRVYPAVLEFMDRTSLEAVHRYLELPLAEGVRASVLVEIDGNRLELEERKNKLSAVVKGAEATEFLEAQSQEEQDRLWLLRRSISPAIGQIKPKKINEDIVVPPSKIPEAVSFINDEAGKAGITVILFGHFGDGNIHTNLMVDPADPGEMQRADQLLDKILRYVISVKGSITGEHGVGLTKKPFMAYQFSPLEIDLFRKIKAVFDPLNLLNPGKIF